MDNHEFIKICGITRIEDAITSLNCGANAIGFVAYPNSPRFIEPFKVKEIISECRTINPDTYFTGVFVSPDIKTVKAYLKSGINTIQIHEKKENNLSQVSAKIAASFPKCNLIISISKYAIAPISETSTWAVLFDSYDPIKIGGTGKLSDWNYAIELKNKIKCRFILAGGLTPENIYEAIIKVKPDGVDASSSLEKSPGIKDHDKIRTFVKNAKHAFHTL